MTGVRWIWKKRRENSRTVTSLVRPHVLKGDVLCVAHNPNCSGTLNAVSRYLQNEQSGTMLNKAEGVLSELELSEEQIPVSWGFEVFEDQIFIFILSKHNLVKLHTKLPANMHFQIQNSKFSYSFHPAWLEFLLQDSEPTPLEMAARQFAPRKL